MAIIRNRLFINIDSGNQLSDTVNSFRADFSGISLEKSYNRVVLTKASVPVSYYVIQNGSNTFTLTENATSVLISIDPGNYNANSFAIKVSQLLSTFSPGHYSYKMTFPNNFTQNNTGKYTYEVNTIVPTISITLGNTTLAEQFGFERNTTHTFTKLVSSSILISDVILKFVPEDTLYIHSDLVDNEFDNVLDSIFFDNSSVFGITAYQCTDIYGFSKRLVKSVNRSPLFTITDESGGPIFFNKLNVCFQIMLWYEDPDDSTSKILKEIRDAIQTLSSIPIQLGKVFESLKKDNIEENSVRRNSENIITDDKN